jgi:hypothetical protein
VGAKVIAECSLSRVGTATFRRWGNPVPPPQVQLEEVNGQARIKKDVESGDPEE